MENMELIQIKEENGQQLVSARELHEFLKVGRDFTTWIKGRIEKYDFVESVDFTAVKLDSPNQGHQKKHGGDRKSVDYALTIDMAKELSMVENNEKGRQARRYFIKCEKKLKELKQVTPSCLIEEAEERCRAWLRENEVRKQLALQNEAQKKEIEEMKPHAELGKAVVANKDCIGFDDMSKILVQNGYNKITFKDGHTGGMGRNNLIKWALEKELVFRAEEENQNEEGIKAYQRHINNKRFEVTENLIKNNKIRFRTLVTGKGQKYFLDEFKKEKNKSLEKIKQLNFIS